MIIKPPKYKIENVDEMSPFLMSITSSDNHWMFISSNGALTAGREKADHALFPYITDNLIHHSLNTTGPSTNIDLEIAGKTIAWRPFNLNKNKGAFRNLYKDAIGDTVLFEESFLPFELNFKRQWFTSKEFGFIMRISIQNFSNKTVSMKIKDGLKNILPSGLDVQTQQSLSNLSNAYKHSEILDGSGIAIYSLGSLIMDKPNPGESLTANTVWCRSNIQFSYSLSNHSTKDNSNLLTGEPGSYFVKSKIKLNPNETASWDIILNTNVDHSQISDLKQSVQLVKAKEINDSIHENNLELKKFVGSADGFQLSNSKNNDMHHTANVLFNIMRGGIFVDNYNIDKSDFSGFVKTRNINTFKKHASLINKVSNENSLEDITTIGLKTGDQNLIRLCYEYLPITFGRRHGDPSRPWNQFHIKVNDHNEKYIYHHEGNWRDIFQNWEGLSISFPYALPSIISKFLNACTQDGYNPYRINKEGIDWEVVDVDDTWSHIGYWNDHQIIYLLKLLEMQWDIKPDFILDNLNNSIFSSSNVPYKIKTDKEIIKNPKETIFFDHDLHNLILQKIETFGTDARLVIKDEKVFHVTMIEKLLVLALTKTSNFIPNGGIWMNTQRPEWNDANNALVGYGTSMVTLYYLRRYLAFINKIINTSKVEILNISNLVSNWFDEVFSVFNDFNYLNGNQEPSPKTQKVFVENLQLAFFNYRKNVYDNTKVERKEITKQSIIDFNDIVLNVFDTTIKSNKRKNLYNAYNTFIFKDSGIFVSDLYPMLEGQVAALSSGKIKTQEAISLITELYDSNIYREDQKSFMLYPEKKLKTFMSKNIIPAKVVQNIDLLKRLIEIDNKDIVYRDSENNYRFHSTIINKNVLEKKLKKLSRDSELQSVVLKDRDNVVDQYMAVFDHQNYTGRSGTMYAYEGIGSIYWHMVSKLLLATQEMFYNATANNEDKDTLISLGTLYYKIRSGLSAEKTAKEYGAFPYDPYSHTPKNKGAQQPGMTGQVKEEIITRMSELGCKVLSGKLTFNISLLRKSEFLKEKSIFKFMNVQKNLKSIEIMKNQIAFTYCQVPIIYSQTDQNWKTTLLYKDNEDVIINDNVLNEQITYDILSRSGKIIEIHVECPIDNFLF